MLISLDWIIYGQKFGDELVVIIYIIRYCDIINLINDGNFIFGWRVAKERSSPSGGPGFSEGPVFGDSGIPNYHVRTLLTLLVLLVPPRCAHFDNVDGSVSSQVSCSPPIRSFLVRLRRSEV